MSQMKADYDSQINQMKAEMKDMKTQYELEKNDLMLQIQNLNMSVLNGVQQSTSDSEYHLVMWYFPCYLHV